MFDRINSTETLVQQLIAEVDFTGKNVTLYEYLVDLDTAMVDMNASFNANQNTYYGIVNYDLEELNYLYLAFENYNHNMNLNAVGDNCNRRNFIAPMSTMATSKSRIEKPTKCACV